MELGRQEQEDFREALWGYYATAARTTLPWRQPEPDGSFDPYKIMVSELMLQQTQVARVIPKYEMFLHLFPMADALATADLGEVLRAWQGLGYNRRAKFLWQAAGAVRERGSFPNTPEDLVKLPGIGTNTAGAILAYAYSQPVVFVETNIRTVYLHHFFHDQEGVSDVQIKDLITQTLDCEHPREFYWALMDYGSHLKATIGNPNKASKHYAKQSRFEGSRRQVRGQIIRLLGARSYSAQALHAAIADERSVAIVAELVKEGMVRQTNDMYSL